MTLTSVNSLSFISRENQECKLRPQIVSVNSNEAVFFLFIIKTNKCSGSCSCNNINDQHAKICIPDNIKNLDVKVWSV